MEEGIFFLWIISLLISAAAWFYVELKMAMEGGFQNRRQITGCELAREVLDRRGFPQTTILPVPGLWRFHFGFDFGRLLLGQKAYFGIQLADLAIALHEVCHLLVPSRSRLRPRREVQDVRIFPALILSSWILFIGASLFPFLARLKPLGPLLFLFLTIRALVSLAEEWEVSERGLREVLGTSERSLLLEGFETDERVRLVRLLRVLRWSGLAELFGEPFSLVFQKKRRIPARVS